MHRARRLVQRTPVTQPGHSACRLLGMAYSARWLVISGLVIPLRIVRPTLCFGPQLLFLFLFFGEFTLAFFVSVVGCCQGSCFLKLRLTVTGRGFQAPAGVRCSGMTAARYACQLAKPSTGPALSLIHI